MAKTAEQNDLAATSDRSPAKAAAAELFTASEHLYEAWEHLTDVDGSGFLRLALEDITQDVCLTADELDDSIRAQARNVERSIKRPGRRRD